MLSRFKAALLLTGLILGCLAAIVLWSSIMVAPLMITNNPIWASWSVVWFIFTMALIYTNDERDS